LVKVNVIEQPACKRLLEIEIPAEEVAAHKDQVIQEYRQSMVLPGFRKVKAPREMVEARLGSTLTDEVMKRALTKGYREALDEARVKPAGDPEIENLEFKPGEPIRFTAAVEVWPELAVKDYRELSLVQEELEVTDDDVDRALQSLREGRVTSHAVDRPAQGGDLIQCEYWMLDEQGQRGEAQEGAIEIGGDNTPEPFNAALMGVHRGESRKIVLPKTVHTSEEGAHEHPERVFEVLVKEVREKEFPPVDDSLAREVMGSEAAGLEDLRAMLRLRIKEQGMRASREKLEDSLLSELLARNPFELPESVVNGALERVVENAAKEHGGELPEAQTARLREMYKPAVERRIRTDLLLESVGRQENVTVTDQEVDQEIERFAAREGKSKAEVKGRLKRGGDLDRLKDDMFRHKVIQTLLGLAKVDVVKKGR
jgi:trigger factor